MKELELSAQCESQQFLNTLYGDIEEEAHLVLWTKQDTKTEFFHVSDIPEATQYAESRKSTHDVYFGLGLQRDKQPSWSRGKANSVVGIPGLWLDLDIVGPGHAETSIPEDREAAMTFLEGLPWKPTLLVNSGGGVHAYWLFKEPWIFDDEKERIEAQELSARFQLHVRNLAKETHGWNLDNTSDLARLLRVPGSLNHKSEPPTIVSIIKHHDQNRFNPDDFEEIVKDIVVPTDFGSEYSGNSDWTPANIDLIVHGCSFMRHCKDDADSLPEPHWHSMMTVLSRCHNALNLVHEWSSPYPKYDKQKTERKLNHALNSPGPHTCQFIETIHQYDQCSGCSNRGKIKSPIQLGAPRRSSAVYNLSSDSNKAERWEAVRDYFPRTNFPWGTLPDGITESLMQLARSCAISPNPLPGVALSTMASTVGNKVTMSPKDSWKEPVIIWHADIRESGEGKTPASRKLIEPLYLFQNKEHERFMAETKKFHAANKKAKGGQNPVMEEPVERGYVTSDFTLEGLNQELSGHPTGGLFCDLSELSAFISGQNQYKSRGTDRENLLKFWDGGHIRVSRKSGSIYIRNPRVSLAGGIQPYVFRTVFGAKNGIALADGTIYRFLFVYEKSKTRKQTPEAWSNSNKQAWYKSIEYSAHWADSRNDPLKMILSKEAQAAFFDWENELREFKEVLPHEFRGFISKASSHCLRLTGATHCLWACHHGCEPDGILGLDDIQRGMKVTEFYLGQSVDAMMTLLGIETSETSHGPSKEAVLAMALKGIKDGLVSNKILMADVMEMYNGLADTDNEFSSSRSFGVFVRGLGFTVPKGTQRVGDKTGVCMEWNSGVDNFISEHAPQNSGDGSV
ncbi:hypothetical protein Dalk_2612 [Desulfatibacillum aliphaticivorans]|uniref:RepB-like DNA primase domain-containing protein n=1 Tax=Desulfatibacillum aliphaticivorans TaxID=218208 RepID=B8FIR4_DESAL|nr:DUF3987 domain-containing protein [Desulfatibacillum aliphaticivorans]ACL04305.1 hypothetical protein Dalk_2612 [Desulfatibacillum aliphaticivorans]